MRPPSNPYPPSISLSTMPHADAVQVRRLTGQDADAFFHLRLQGLEREPEAFTESAEEFRRTGTGHAVRNLAKSDNNNFVMGAFVGGELAGLAGFYRHKRSEERRVGKECRSWRLAYQ